MALKPSSFSSFGYRDSRRAIRAEALRILCHDTDASVWPERGEAGDSDLQHGDVARVQARVAARLDENTHWPRGTGRRNGGATAFLTLTRHQGQQTRVSVGSNRWWL